MLKVGDLVIANDYDRPEAKNICIVTFVNPQWCDLRYLGRENWEINNVPLDSPEYLEAFGVEIEIEHNQDNSYYNTRSFAPSIAQYNNGDIRHWQESTPSKPQIFDRKSFQFLSSHNINNIDI